MLKTDKVIYHVETQEDYDDLMVELEKLGCKWCSGKKPTAYNRWNGYKTKTCVKLNSKEMMYADIDFYKQHYPEYEIIKYKKG